jgi:hypothetical protein
VSPLVAILILLLLAVVILVVAAPLRPRHGDPDDDGDGAVHADVPSERGSHHAPAPRADALARADLEAARETKYREIRDSEMDYRTGKLSAEDYGAIDAQLRAEALEILNRLERLDTSARNAAGERGDAGGEPPRRQDA